MRPVMMKVMQQQDYTHQSASCTYTIKITFLTRHLSWLYRTYCRSFKL